jgi:antitoxin PrlF
VEVLDDTMLLLRLEPEDQQPGEADEDSLMLGLFLDFLIRQAPTAEQGPVPYTEAMAGRSPSSPSCLHGNTAS